MSLVAFRANNHPQQIGRRGAKPSIDERATPPELFGRFNDRFRFTIDVAALPHNAKCERYFTPADDGLSQSWAGERVWCNPPYSDVYSWVEKAWLECDSAEVIVMLLPANRTEQAWWQELVEPYRDGRGDLRVEFIAGRQRFIGRDKDRIEANERPPFGVCLLVWGHA